MLVVDADEENALRLHRALYTARRRFDVIAVDAASAAQDVMRDVSIDVLVAAADLPGLGSVGLARWAAAESPDTLLVLISDEPVATVKKRMDGLGCVRLIAKPCRLAEVVQTVREALQARHRLAGSFAALSAAELIQMMCLAQRTVALHISARGTEGQVVIVGGKLVHATWGQTVGEKAIRHMITAEEGVFRTSPVVDAGPHTITRDWEHVLMDAARVVDELANGTYRSSTHLPALGMDDAVADETLPDWTSDAILEAPATDWDPLSEAGTAVFSSSGAASSLVDEGFAAVRAGNLPEARRCWEAAKELDPQNRSLDLNLRRLDSMGTR